MEGDNILKRQELDDRGKQRNRSGNNNHKEKMTQEELKEVDQKRKMGKAPDIDEITTVMIKLMNGTRK